MATGFLIGIGIFFCLAIFLWIVISAEDTPQKNWGQMILMIILLVLYSSILYWYWDVDQPKAIDVYRGGVEIEVTGQWVNDSTFIPTDSTVVYKPGYKPRK